MAPEEAACNLIHFHQWCHSVAILHCGECRRQVLKKDFSGSLLDYPEWVQQCHRSAMLDQWTAFQNRMPTLPTMQLSQEVEWHLTGGKLSDYMQLPLEPQKAHYYFFTYAVVLPKTCKHTPVMCKIGGFTLFNTVLYQIYPLPLTSICVPLFKVLRWP